MKSITIGACMGMLVLVALTASGAASQGPNPPAGGNTPGGVVAAAISYQGRLAHPATGAPLSGTYDLEFTFWSLPSGGVQVGATIPKDDQVIANGLYSTALTVDPAHFNGQEMWLGIRVKPGTGGSWETLSPRVQVLPTAYALGLRPGAIISGSVAAPDAVLRAVNTSSGGYGVHGEASHVGVHGITGGGSIIDYGVYGSASTGTAYGVYGNKAGNSGGLGVFGRNDSGGGSGVSGYGTDNAVGTWGYSFNYNGVGGGTGRMDNNWGLYTNDNCHASGYTMLSAVTQVVQNGDTEALERGDVVVIAGVGRSPVEGVPPLIQVSKARQANSTGVIGVVASSYAAEWLASETDPTGATAGGKEIPLAGPGPIAPGEYLLIVVQGPTQVKASARAGAIRPGDLLACAGTAGHAAKAATVGVRGTWAAMPGTVLGKALEPLDADQELIYVFVSLQ